MTPSRTQIARSQIEGALLGTLVGDSLGARVEGLGLGPLTHRYPDRAALAALAPGRYGAATEMTAAVAASLARFPGFNAADMAAELVRWASRDRAYGHGTLAAIERLRRGEDWRRAATTPGRTSFGNGAAARAAPIGLAFAADAEMLRWVAEEAASITHAHALACEGAVLQAMAAAMAARGGGRPLVSQDFLLALGAEAEMREYRSRYESAARLVVRGADARRLVDVLGHGRSALGSVVTAAACFARFPDDFEAAVVAALELGGNAMAIAAMTGALAGARLGADAIPARWLDRCERAAISAERLRELAEVLARALRERRGEEAPARADRR